MSALRSVRALFATLLVASVASGCSGGSPIVPPPGVAPAQPLSGKGDETGWARIRFRIPIPGRTRLDEPHRLFPHYVSASTSKVVAIVRGLGQKKASKQTFACKAVCTGSIVAPVGPDLVTLKLEDHINDVLSQGTATILVFAKKHNVFNFTLDGVPRFVALAPVPSVVPVTPASSGYIIFQALDADGNLITPDGNYTNSKGQALAFDVASSNASFRLGVRTVSAPGTLIPFFYDGTQHVGTVKLKPSVRAGVKANVTFASGSVTLVPGIATRIPPPLPVQVVSVTQVPIPGGNSSCSGFPCTDGNDDFFFANSGGQAAALAFNVATGAYGIATADQVGGPFTGPPIDFGGGNGFMGYINPGNGTYNSAEYDDGGLALATGLTNPCASGMTPIGKTQAGVTYCQESGFPALVYNATTASTAAAGLARLIRTIDGIDYIVTANTTSATPPGQQVYASGTLVSEALCVGENVRVLSNGYYGDSDGTVKAIGGGTVATFANPIENVIASGSKIFAYENGGVFGVSGTSGTFESQPLPIGAVVDVVTGVNGAPMLVESDGTLDVMAI
jgi:hypothetical protein